MQFGLTGKTALVVASSQGLGYAAALELAREGAKVVICSRDQSRIEQAASRIIKETSADVLPLVADLRQADDITKLVAQARQHFGGIDILVTNAGGPPAGYFGDIDDQSWSAGFELTLLSVVRLIRQVLPDMRQRKWGRIVNIVSISVKQPIAGLLISNAIRPGLIGMAKSLADEVATEGITVNNVCPGWTRTERVEQLLRARSEREGISLAAAEKGIVDSIPMKRMGEPDELAALIAFLCSSRASYLTGTTIQVDGGAFRGLQ